jgi:Ca2+-binding EF-hand superfamily protein
MFILVVSQIDIEQLINKIDTDGSGEIEFDEFSLMLGK